MAKTKTAVTVGNVNLADLTDEQLSELRDKAYILQNERRNADREKQQAEKLAKAAPKLKKLKSEVEKLIASAPNETMSNEFDVTLTVNNGAEINFRDADIYNNFNYEVKGGGRMDADKNQLLVEAMQSVVDNYGGENDFFERFGSVDNTEAIQKEVEDFQAALEKKYGNLTRKLPLRIKLNANVSTNEDHILSQDFYYGDLEANDGVFEVTYDCEVSGDVSKEEKAYLQDAFNDYLSGICFDGMHFVPAGLKKLVKFCRDANAIGKTLKELEGSFTFQDVLDDYFVELS